MEVDAREVGHPNERVAVVADDVADRFASALRADTFCQDPLGRVVGSVMSLGAAFW